MSQFDESKLSRILARRIIAPEDRSQFLPMCTPIYCPDNNGVKASQVTIIDPNLNTFFNDVDPTNTRSKYIGSQLDSTSGVRYPSGATIPEGVTIDPETGYISGLYTGDSSTNRYINANIRTGVFQIAFTAPKNYNVNRTPTVFGFTGNNGLSLTFNEKQLRFYYGTNQYIYLGSFQVNEKIIAKITVTETSISLQINDGDIQTVNVSTSGTAMLYAAKTSSGGINSLDQTKATAYGYETYINGVPLTEKITEPQVSKQPNEVQNIINIDLNKSVSRDYFVPYEVELKSDADIMSVIKSDFAAYFKNRVSNEIVEQLVLLHTTNAISTINKGATLAETFGDVISTFISQGTGQKFSIYKYNNGAPVVYSEDSSQPNIDKDINQTTDMTFAIKDDISVPALYYVEQPTLILPNTTFADFQTELCNGNIKDYARRMVNVETATANFGQLGEGVFGTNDTFAVAFSSPSIKLVPDTNFYGYRLCCTMLYGVKLVHKHNLRLIV